MAVGETAVFVFAQGNPSWSSVTAADVRIFEPSSGLPLCDHIYVFNNGVSSGGRRIECVVAKSLMAGDYAYKIRLHPFGYARNDITEPKSTVIRVRPLIHRVDILDHNFTNNFNGHNGDGSTWEVLGGATNNAVSSAGGGRALRITGMGLIHWGAPTRVTLGNGLIGLNGGNGLRCDVVDSLTTPNKWKLVFRQTAGSNTDPSEGPMTSGYFKPRQWSRSPASPTAPNHAILDTLETYRSKPIKGGGFTFRLSYPHMTERGGAAARAGEMVWKQTSNPTLETTKIGTVEGYVCVM